MFLNYYGLTENKKFEKDQLKIEKSYKYWQDSLFEKCMRIFVWEGLPFPQKEIELRLLINGYCGFVNDRLLGYLVTNGSMNGTTQYFDEFKNFTYSVVGGSGGNPLINKECVIINNTQIRNPLLPMICRTASLLSHTEISLKCALVNLRENNTFTTSDENTADNIRAYRQKCYDGDLDVILDESLINSVQSLSNSTNNSLGVKECLDARNEILRSFFNSIGVRYTKEKSERMITNEVESDTQLLLINIKDMLSERQMACEEINKLFNLNISVKLSDEFRLIERSENNDD